MGVGLLGLFRGARRGARQNRKLGKRESLPGPARAAAGAGREPHALEGRSSLRRLGALLWPERFPELASWRAEQDERRRARVPRGFLWVWTLAVALAAAAFVAHLHVRFEIVQTGYALSRAQTEQRRLRLEQRELRLEMATLKEPGRIEEQARTLLGMERPDYQRIIRLDGGRGQPALAEGGR